MQGSYNELVESNKDFIEMMASLSDRAQKKEEEARRITQISMRKASLVKRLSVISTTSSIVVRHNDYLSSTFSSLLKFSYLVFINFANWYVNLFASQRYFFHININNFVKPQKRFVTPQYSDIDDISYGEDNSLDGEAMAHGYLSGKVYRKYLHYGANYCILFILLMSFIISQVATTGNDYWTSYWTNLEQARQIKNTTNYVDEYKNMRNDSFLSLIFDLDPDGLLSTTSAIYVYTFTILACTITTLFRSFLFMKICMNSSTNLHNNMFTNLVQARMSFFNANPAGKSKSLALSIRWKLWINVLSFFYLLFFLYAFFSVFMIIREETR